MLSILSLKYMLCLLQLIYSALYLKLLSEYAYYVDQWDKTKQASAACYLCPADGGRSPFSDIQYGRLLHKTTKTCIVEYQVYPIYLCKLVPYIPYSCKKLSIFCLRNADCICMYAPLQGVLLYRCMSMCNIMHVIIHANVH